MKLAMQTIPKKMNDILTLSRLQKIHDEFKMDQPFSKSPVGIVINDEAWRAIKEEIEANSPHYIYDGSKSDVDYLWGSAIYETPNISPTYAEVYFDREALKKRLKELCKNSTITNIQTMASNGD